MKSHVALIHNNDEKRLALIRPTVAELSTLLGASCKEYSWQPDLTDERLSSARRRSNARYALKRHNKNLGFRSGSGSSVWARLSLNLLWRHKRFRKQIRTLSRTSDIEQVLTDKHIRAWAEFLDASSDFLIVIEDDAVMSWAGSSKLRQLLLRADLAPSGLLYMDLAGGFELSQLADARNFVIRDDGLVWTVRPITNTTCAYVLNRSMADALLSELLCDPLLRVLGPGWLLNELLQRVYRRSPLDCIHNEQPVYGHGSFLGIHASSIESRIEMTDGRIGRSDVLD